MRHAKMFLKVRNQTEETYPKFSHGLGWTKFNLQQKIHFVFVDVSGRIVLLSKHKIDVKENIMLKHDVNKNEDIEQLHSGNHVNSTNSVRNLTYFLLSRQHNIETFDRGRY